MDRQNIALILQQLGIASVVNFRELSLAGFHRFYRLETDSGNFFIKVGNLSDLENYAAEKRGLEALEKTHTLRVPHPYLCGTHNREAYLVLEHIEMVPDRAGSGHLLGEKLAQLHLNKGSERFGFDVDNALGSTRQVNTWSGHWVAFFLQQRLQFQLKLAHERYHDKELVQAGEALMKRFPDYFERVSVRPSLLHGDLWAGNVGYMSNGEPVAFDPACYWGHHEAELSIMRMFGGFSEELFSVYHTYIPKAPGFEERHACYQLYHYLNHYHIFGESYRHSCLRIIKSLLN